jgi:hypothetical protein
MIGSCNQNIHQKQNKLQGLAKIKANVTPIYAIEGAHKKTGHILIRTRPKSSLKVADRSPSGRVGKSRQKNKEKICFTKFLSSNTTTQPLGDRLPTFLFQHEIWKWYTTTFPIPRGRPWPCYRGGHTNKNGRQSLAITALNIEF